MSLSKSEIESKLEWVDTFGPNVDAYKDGTTIYVVDTVEDETIITKRQMTEEEKIEYGVKRSVPRFDGSDEAMRFMDRCEYQTELRRIDDLS